MTLYHATVVALEDRGIMITGSSGCGKSDLALRLIEEAGAKLVGDDYVTLVREADGLVARPAENIAGMIEVRGVGLVKMPFRPSVSVDLVLLLLDPEGTAYPERLPAEQFFEHEGICVPQLEFMALEASAVAKVRAALRHFLS